MGEDWLEAVLSRDPSTGATWAALRDGELLAVVETAFCPDDPRLAAITALATRPCLHRQGVGTTVLKRLLRHHHEEGRPQHLAYIKANNGAALRCFRRVGFVVSGLEPNEHGYLLFRYSCV